MKKNIIFINSHPIQYFAPLYKYMNEQGVNTACWYCSDESVRGGMDKQFGVKIKWDIPLLEGYHYQFFRNNSWKKSHTSGFFGLMNFGLIRQLFRTPESIITVHGYHYFTHLLVLLLGKFRGHTVCLRCEHPYNQEQLKRGWKQQIKRFALQHILFKRIDYFLYIGKQNQQFYKSYGVGDKQLVFCPYTVDNGRFRIEYESLTKEVPLIKENLGIPASAKVIVYSAKYISKKRPLDILKAFQTLSDGNLWLVMVGEGELRGEMEAYITGHHLKNVILTGFVNQSRISEFYALGDVFVMCSGSGETWGLSVNEAMNFNLPLVISDLTGCADDLVEQGVNGYTFKTGDTKDLAEKLDMVLKNPGLMDSASSINVINNYSYEVITQNLRTLA